jgi:hypothetical protein
MTVKATQIARCGDTLSRRDYLLMLPPGGGGGGGGGGTGPPLVGGRVTPEDVFEPGTDVLVDCPGDPAWAIS